MTNWFMGSFAEYHLPIKPFEIKKNNETKKKYYCLLFIAKYFYSIYSFFFQQSTELPDQKQCRLTFKNTISKMMGDSLLYCSLMFEK